MGFTKDIPGIDFRELSLTRGFTAINFRECVLYKDFASKFSVCLKKYFLHDLS